MRVNGGLKSTSTFHSDDALNFMMSQLVITHHINIKGSAAVESTARRTNDSRWLAQLRITFCLNVSTCTARHRTRPCNNHKKKLLSRWAWVQRKNCERHGRKVGSVDIQYRFRDIQITFIAVRPPAVPPHSSKDRPSKAERRTVKTNYRSA